MSYRRRHSFRPMFDQLEKRDFPGPWWEGFGGLLLGSELAFLLGNPTEASTAGAAAASTSESLESSWLVPAGSPVGDFGFLNAFASNRSNRSESPPINSFNSQTLNSDELDYVFAFDQDQFDDLLDVDFEVLSSSTAGARTPALSGRASGSQGSAPTGRFVSPVASASIGNQPTAHSPAPIRPLEVRGESLTAAAVDSFFSESLTSDGPCSGGEYAKIEATKPDAYELADGGLPEAGEFTIGCIGTFGETITFEIDTTDADDATYGEDYLLSDNDGLSVVMVTSNSGTVSGSVQLLVNDQATIYVNPITTVRLKVE